MKLNNGTEESNCDPIGKNERKMMKPKKKKENDPQTNKIQFKTEKKINEKSSIERKNVIGIRHTASKQIFFLFRHKFDLTLAVSEKEKKENKKIQNKNEKNQIAFVSQCAFGKINAKEKSLEKTKHKIKTQSVSASFLAEKMTK